MRTERWFLTRLCLWGLLCGLTLAVVQLLALAGFAGCDRVGAGQSPGRYGGGRFGGDCVAGGSRTGGWWLPLAPPSQPLSLS